ncbi:MMPL family transporter [Haloarcula hispanica]|uniref:RND transporter n=1 Tax=Haloarcula hispanica TaxID=51589 RepID=A0A482T1G2_HALHI|nr:MMPL family transporter [Haloarcula hispanica]MCJ0619773.1 MMPL family transporter [Haloarcula hispanica]RYJ10228.1 RND transporter [Haloarcula hispanica]
MSLAERVETATERLNTTIVDRPRAVIVVFLLVTGVFVGGLGSVQVSAGGLDSFTEGLPEQEAEDEVTENFQGPFQSDTQDTTQLIRTDSNVLTKEALVRDARLIERVADRDDLRMESASGPAPTIAQQLNPSAETPEAYRQTLERAPRSDIRQAIRELEDKSRLTGSVSNDFNPTSVSASASITTISHDFPSSFDDLTAVQTGVQRVANDMPGDIRAFGSGTTEAEIRQSMSDSLLIVMPVVILLLLFFLVVAYRDPIDVLLGLVTLVMTIIWTFGFLGYARIPFSQQMISVPVLLLAVGVDFGIHIINRYREETARGFTAVEAMREANDQLIVAFVIVTVTAVFGFGANVISTLTPIRNLGIASAVGILFTFLLFGVFLPAAKLVSDDLRTRLGVPEFNSAPIASEDSVLGRMLAFPAQVSQYAPTVIVLGLLLSGGLMGAYGSGVGTSFENEDFLPPEEIPAYLTELPESLSPGEYTITSTINLLDDKFGSSQGSTVKIYVQGNLKQDHALEALAAPNDDPPESLAVGPGGQAEARSIVTVIKSHANENEEFAALVARNDQNDNGIPDQNLEQIYDELFSSSASDRAERYLTEDYRSAQIEYRTDSDATQTEVTAGGAELADRLRFEATATGSVVVLAAVMDRIFQSAIQGLVMAVGLTAAFLVIIYGILERKPLLGVVNIFPILVAIAFLLGTMRYLNITLNALTATILSISVGVGIAYSVHTTHRFIDEYDATTGAHEAMMVTLTGTGGALFGSMLTTALGTGALALAITPILGNFGVLIGLSVTYSFLAAVIALPPAVLLWERIHQWDIDLLARLRPTIQ